MTSALEVRLISTAIEDVMMTPAAREVQPEYVGGFPTYENWLCEIRYDLLQIPYSPLDGAQLRRQEVMLQLGAVMNRWPAERRRLRIVHDRVKALVIE